MLSKEDKNLFGQLLAPSWLSAMVAIIVGLIITLGVLIAFSVNNSSIQRQLVGWQQSQPEKPQKALTTPDQIVRSDDKPKLQDSWPLLVVWAGVGLLVYAITAWVIHSLGNAESLRESMGYVNARPREQLRAAAGHLILRGLALAILVILVYLFFHEVIPYSITAAHAGTVELPSTTGGLYALLSFLIIVVSIQMQTIFLRLSTGRVRVFSS
jgi:hypothetical protein